MTFETLAVDDIRKRMGAVQALGGVSLTAKAGAVHGIIGHNGSGKSTLVKVLSGVLSADSGSFYARDAGNDGVHRPPRVATVYQDLGLADNLTVLENLLVNSFESNKAGLVSIKNERRRALESMKRLGMDLPLDEEAGRLLEPEQVMLCVARALIHGGIPIDGDSGDAGVDVLILDEPTSSLPRNELERFRALIRGLRETLPSLAILIVTHNPGDIGAMCDDLTALKNGQVLASCSASDVSMTDLATLMAGTSVDSSLNFNEQAAVNGRPAAGDADAALRIDSLFVHGLTAPVSVTVKRGELVGFTGLEGSGFREFIAAAMGIREPSSGEVFVQGKRLACDPAALPAAGAIYIPSDRARTSGIPSATAYENMTLGRLDPFCRRGFVNRRKERAAVADMMRQLRVDPPDPDRTLAEMSGGQQQKIVVGRALLSGAKLLVFEEPTAAVDVGARAEILGYLHKATREESAVVVASAEFEWMGAVCDRIVVFRAGQVSGDLTGADMTEAGVLSLAYGE